MGTADTTRHLHQPAKHYVGARLQRGRVVTDADIDERQLTEQDDVRATWVDVIGPKGTPDDGFRVFDPVMVDIGGTDRLDFSIDVGTMYVGGLRFEHDEVEQARFQTDWLQLVPEDLAPWPALVGNETRTDLVYLEGIEEVVTAREDRELLETALGGHDTSTRVRKSVRVRVLSDVGDVSCKEAFGQLSDAYFAECRRRIDLDTCEVAPVEQTLRLRIEELPPEQLALLCPPCAPDPQGPFLGADHRSIRVMVGLDRHAFTWGFDNAAPLYRVEVSGTGTVTFIDRPARPQHYPRAGEVVEILGWSRLLPGGEKVATAAGFVTRAQTAYDPFTAQLVLDAPIPADALVTSWPGHPRAAELPGPEGLTYYLRVWDRGPIGDVPPEPLLPIVSGALVPLGSTGLGVRFTGNRGCSGDFWLVADRPTSGHRVLPWAIGETAVSAFGPRRHVAPLALVTWGVSGGDVVVERVHDCRTRFGPLTCSACCVVTVGGKGTEAAGNFTTLQAAIDALPVDGGTICVMPGEHVGRFFLRERRGITIVGCGATTRLVAGADDGNADPLGFVCDSSDIRIADLAVSPRGIAGIQVREHSPGQTVDIVLERLVVETQADPGAHASPKSAIELLGGSRLTVRRCRLGMPCGEPSLHPVALLSGAQVAFDDNRVECFGAVASGRRAWGGVQIGGTALDVRVQGNAIRGGFGHGITLGSIAYEDSEPNPVAHVVPVGAAAMSFAFGVDPRLSLEVLRPFGAALDSPQPVPSSVLVGIVVRDNVVEDHGGSGIAVAAFWPATTDDQPDAVIGTTDLQIVDNRIQHCLLETPIDLPGHTALVAAGGGICLGDADGVVITGNVIRDCAPRRAGCGVFTVAASEAIVERNAIVAIGGTRGTSVGVKGGIVINAAIASVDVQQPPPGAIDEHRAAARIVGNLVQQPSGRALHIDGFGGALVVAANVLGSAGDDDPGPIAAPATLQVQAGRVNDGGGIAVHVFNTGISYDLRSLLPGDPAAPAEESLDDGRILFTDNQVTLDWPTRVARGPFLASTVLLSLDETAVVGNQFVAKLDAPPVSTSPDAWPSQTLNPAFAMGDRLLTQLLAVGSTVKIDANRVTEGLTDALVSAVGIAVVEDFSVIARLNDATHCVIAGYVGAAVSEPFRVLNHELVDPPAPSAPSSARFCDARRVAIRVLPTPDATGFAFDVQLDAIP
jgi:hypothetical protein